MYNWREDSEHPYFAERMAQSQNEESGIMSNLPKIFHDGERVTVSHAGEIARGFVSERGLDASEVVEVFKRALCYGENDSGEMVFDSELFADDGEDAREMLFSMVELEVIV